MFDTLKKVAKNSAIYGVGNLSTKLIGFILLPLYTSYISVGDYGILAITEITSLVLVAVISLRIVLHVIQYFYQRLYHKK